LLAAAIGDWGEAERERERDRASDRQRGIRERMLPPKMITTPIKKLQVCHYF